MERSSGAAPSRQPGGSGPDTASPINVHIEDARDGVTIVGIAGELDLGTIPRIEGPLFEQIRQRSAVLVNLTRLSFIDSSGIGVLIQAFRASNGTPMHFVISPGSQVERVFWIAGVSDALPVYLDRDQALTAMSDGRDGGSADGDGLNVQPVR